MTSFVPLPAEGLAMPGRAGEEAGPDDEAKKLEEAESLRKQDGDKPSQRRVAAGES
jgi:hypothetical protein